MKKIIIRLIGSLCILGALAVLLLTTWVELDGASRKELRELRNQLQEDLAMAEEKMQYYSDMEMFDEELKEYGLPRSPSKIKSRFKDTEALIKELVNTEISFGEILWVAKEAPGYIEDTEALLEIPALAEKLIQTGASVEYEIDVESMEETIDSVADFKAIFVIVVGFFIILMALALVSAVTHMLNKVRWVKYIFLVLLVAIVVGVCVGVPMLTDVIHDELYLTSAFEDMSLQVTVMPYFAAALMLVPVVLDIIFERKKKAAAV